MRPRLEFMCSANGIERLLARFQASLSKISPQIRQRFHGSSQMIGIVKAKATTRLFELLWSQAFQRTLCRDRHKHWKLYGSMREMERGSSRLCGLREENRQSIYHISKIVWILHTEHFVTKSNVKALETRFETMSLFSSMAEVKLKLDGLSGRAL